MTEFLIVPAASMARFQGTYSDLAALDPRLLTSGDGMLPAKLLREQDVIAACPHLEILEVREVGDREFAAVDETVRRIPKRTRLAGRLTDADKTRADSRIAARAPATRTRIGGR